MKKFRIFIKQLHENNKISVYTLIVITFFCVLCLCSFTIFSTYALFTSETITEKGINISTASSYSFDLISAEEYQRISVPANSIKKIKVNIKNSNTESLYYGVWYEIVTNSSLSLSTDIKNNVSLASDSSVEMTVELENNSNATAVLNIGVAANTQAVVVDEPRYLIENMIEEDVNEPNPPELSSKMIPVVYDSDSGKWLKADSNNTNNNWYDYFNRQWANMVLVSNAMLYDDSRNGRNIVYPTSDQASINDSNWLTLNGTSSDIKDYLSLGLNSYDFGKTFSVAIRFRINTLSTSVNQRIISNEESAGFAIYYRYSTGTLSALFKDEDGTQTSIISDVTITEGTWYTAVFTYDAETTQKANLYIGTGTTIASTTTVDVTKNVSVSASPLALGCNPSPAGTCSNLAPTTIARVAIYDGVLTSAEVTKCIESYVTTVYVTPENYTEADSGTYITSSSTAEPLIHIRTFAKHDYQSEYLAKEVGEEIPIDNNILGFYTWIPRFKYKVWNISRSSSNTTSYGTYYSYTKGIDIVWENGINTTGTVNCVYNTNNPSGKAETCSGSNEEYYTHPAFTYGSEELTGFWIAKFELSSELSSVKYSGNNRNNLLPKSVPNSQSWTYNTIANFYTAIDNMNSSDNFYGLDNTSFNSHLIKNNEWGAVAYLTYSKYGLCPNDSCNEIGYNNYFDSTYKFQTGCGTTASTSTSAGVYSSTCNRYDTQTGMKASTTGNITGVYDMSGGAEEYTFGVMNTATTATKSNVPITWTTMDDGENDYSGFNGVGDDGSTEYTEGIDLPETKKYFQYANRSSVLEMDHLGDGLGEINGTWYNDELTIPNINKSFTIRGGTSYDDTGANIGILSSRGGSGVYGGIVGTRNTIVTTILNDLQSYTSKTYTITLVKGSNVSAIGATSLSCTTASGTSSCTVTLPSITANTGYKVVGWGTSSTATTTVAVNSEITLTSNKTYYSIVTPFTYTVTLNNQSATSAGTTKIYSKYNTGVYLDSALSNKMTTSANKITIPTKTGYTFGGYYTATGGSGTQLISSTGYITSSFTTTLLSATTTLYAKWTANTYTLTLNNQSATSAGTTKIYSKYNTGIYLDSALSKKMTTSANKITIPTKTGYTFGGYYTATGGSGTQMISSSGYITSNLTTTKYTANTTLYAKWTAKTITITLNNQSATSAGTTKIYSKYNTGVYLDSALSKKMTTSANKITVPQKTWFKFGGYYTATKGSGTQMISSSGYITSSLTSTKYSSGATLYAKWSISGTSATWRTTYYVYNAPGWYNASLSGASSHIVGTIAAGKTIYYYSDVQKNLNGQNWYYTPILIKASDLTSIQEANIGTSNDITYNGTRYILAYVIATISGVRPFY